MPIKFKRKVLANHGSLLVNIPKEIAEELDIKKGDILELTLDNRSYTTKKTD